MSGTESFIPEGLGEGSLILISRDPAFNNPTLGIVRSIGVGRKNIAAVALTETGWVPFNFLWYRRTNLEQRRIALETFPDYAFFDLAPQTEMLFLMRDKIRELEGRIRQCEAPPKPNRQKRSTPQSRRAGTLAALAAE